jgi:hypothetical protein
MPIVPNLPSTAHHLSHVKICTTDYFHDMAFDTAARHVDLILAYVDSPVLEILSLHLGLNDVRLPPVWTELDAALVKFQARHPTLRSVVLVLACEGKWESKANTALPRLNATGLLQTQLRPHSSGGI